MTGLSRRALAWIFALGLAARLAVLPYTLPRYDRGRAYPDTLQYEAMARNFQNGQGLIVGPGQEAVRPPLYPLLLWLVPSGLGVILLQCGIGAATGALAADMGARLFGTTAGILAGIGCALHPELVLYPSLLLSETLAIGLVVLALWASAGAACGAAALTRASLLVLPAGLALWLALAVRPQTALVCLLGAAAVVAPWTLRNRVRLGAWIPVTTKMGWDLYEQCCDEATGGPGGGIVHWPDEARALGEVEGDRCLRTKALDWVRTHPARFLALTLERLRRFWNPLPNDREHRTPGVMTVALIANVPLFGLALLSLCRVLRPSPSAWVLAALPALLLCAVHAVFTGSVRYRAPALPGVAILASAALVRRRDSL